MADKTKDELMRLRAENEKLKAQIEGLKECVGFTAMQIVFPSFSYDMLLALGKKMMENQDVDAFINRFMENTKPKSILEQAKEIQKIQTMTQFLSEFSG